MGTTFTVSRVTVKWVRVTEASIRVNRNWVLLFPCSLCADLKIGAIARIVVGRYKTRQNQSVPPGRPANGGYGASRRPFRLGPAKTSSEQER